MAAPKDVPLFTTGNFPKLPSQKIVYTLEQLKEDLKDPKFSGANIGADEMTFEALQYYVAFLKQRRQINEKKAKRKIRRLREDIKGVKATSGGKKKKTAFAEFNTHRPYSDSNCTICLGKIRKGNKFKTICGHWYHMTCFHTLAEQTNTCAVCRGNMLL